MTIDVYGATWCGDCRQAKNTLDKLGAAYTWHNIEEEEGAADRAVAISGQMHIPVVRYDDGSFQVEPSAVDIRNWGCWLTRNPWSELHKACVIDRS